MEEEYRSIFEKLKQINKSGKYEWFQACGNPDLRNGLMVVGRAVNSWKPFTPEKNSFESLYESECDIFPDGNVAGYFNGYGYNICSSAFWRTVRGTAMSLYPCGPHDFGKYITYTNLYKIAPPSSNPGAVLQRIQRMECIEILKQEILHWQPKYILFLTDWNWAEPFLTAPSFQYVPKNVSCNQLKSCGVLLDGIKTAVIPHPQGKSETGLAGQVASFFKGN